MARAVVVATIVLLAAAARAGDGPAVAAAATPGATAPGDWSAGGELILGGGYDTNLYLQVAASPDSPNYHSYRGAFVRANPSLVAAIGGSRLRVQLRYGADLLQTFGGGRLYVQEAELALALAELGPASARLAVVGGRFDAGAFPSDRFWSVGAAAQLVAWLAGPLRAGVFYEIDRRQFGDPAAILIEDDLAQRVQARVAVLPSAPFEVAAGLDYLTLRSRASDGAQPDARLSRWRVAVDAAFTPVATLTLSASLWGGLQRSAVNPGTNDRQAGGAATVLGRVSAAVDVMARYEILVNRSSVPDSDYARQVATAGLVAHAPTIGSPRRRAAGDDDSATASLAPAINGGRVRFRSRAHGAASVAVIGSWNDWLSDAPEQQLRATRDPDLWEGWVDVGPGRHRYHFLIDGRPARPDHAPQYQADDFGSEDGVLEIAETPARPGQ